MIEVLNPQPASGYAERIKALNLQAEGLLVESNGRTLGSALSGTDWAESAQIPLPETGLKQHPLAPKAPALGSE